MKTLVSQKTLLSAIQTVSKTINRNSALPILTHARLRAGACGLEITGTDLDTTVQVIIPDQNGMPEQFDNGATCISARKFADTVKLCHDDIALFSTDAGLCVKNGSTFTLATLPTDDFPVLPQVNCALHKITVTAGELRKALSRVEMAQSTDDARYVLQGVYFEFGPECARLVATDGRRLHVQEIFADTSEAVFTSKTISALVHSKTISVLLAALPKTKRGNSNQDSSPVTIIFGKWNNPTNENSYIAFNFSSGVQSIEITAKQIAGNFPLYRQVIPAESRQQIGFNPEQFANAIKAASAGCTDAANSVKLTFNADGLTVTGKSVANAEAVATLPCQFRATEKHPSLAIAFDPEYIGEAALALGDHPGMSLCLMDELSPGKIVTDDGFLAVVMPMRLS